MGTNVYFLIVLVGCCGYALWKGGSPERAVAAIFLVGVLFTRLAASSAHSRFSSVESGIFFVDLAVLAAFLAVALRADRFWPLWLTALHLVGTAGHAVKLVDAEVIRWGYAFALAFWSYPMLLILALATRRHQARLARFGADRSWTSFSILSARPRSGRPV